MEPDASVAAAIDSLQQTSSDFVVVGAGNASTCVITAKVLALYPVTRLLMDCPVEGIVKVAEETHIEDALALLDDQQLPSVLVVDESDHVIGAVDRAKLVAAVGVSLTRLVAQQKVALRIFEILATERAGADAMREIIVAMIDASGTDAGALRLQEGLDFPFFVRSGFTDEFVADENRLCTYDEGGKLRCNQDGSPVLECLCGAVLSGTTDPSRPYFTDKGSFWTSNLTAIVAQMPVDHRRRLRTGCLAARFESMMLVPLHVGERVIGLLQLNGRQEGAFTAEIVAFYECLVASIAIAVERHEEEKRFLQVQKMEAIGTLAAGVAHDLNNVLAVILGLGSLLKDELADADPKRQDIHEIISAARRGKRSVESLLGFARQGEHSKSPLSLNRAVRDAVEMLRNSISKLVKLEISLAESLPQILGDPSQVVQILVNLCLNAADAISGPGTITITTTVEVVHPRASTADPELPPGRYVKLEVRDDGQGMHPETQKRMLEPFFTTKGVGKGTGLGLSMVYGTVKSYGGSMHIKSSPGAGTSVTIHFVSCDEAGSEKQRPISSRIVRSGQGKILLVDDERAVRAMGKRVLAAAGYEVILADSGEAAIEIFQTHRDDIDLVLLDLSMPDMGGVECFEHLKKLDGDVRVLICTGHMNSTDAKTMVAGGAVGVITKPFELRGIVEVLGSLLSGGDRP